MRPEGETLLGLPGTWGLRSPHSPRRRARSSTRSPRRVSILSPPVPRTASRGSGTVREDVRVRLPQRRMFRDFYAGSFHIFIFSGSSCSSSAPSRSSSGARARFVLSPTQRGDAYTSSRKTCSRSSVPSVSHAVFPAPGGSRGPGRLDLTAWNAWFICFSLPDSSRRHRFRKGDEGGAGAGARDRVVAGWCRSRPDAAGPARACYRRSRGRVVDAPHRYRSSATTAVLEAPSTSWTSVPNRLLHEARADGQPRHAGPETAEHFGVSRSR